MPRRLALLSAIALTIPACGGGALSPTDAAFASQLTVKVAPELSAMTRRQPRFFKAVPVKGRVPAGTTYTWQVLGRGTLARAAGDSVLYTAPDADGVDTLAVLVRSATGETLGSGATPVRTMTSAWLRTDTGGSVSP